MKFLYHLLLLALVAGLVLADSSDSSDSDSDSSDSSDSSGHKHHKKHHKKDHDHVVYVPVYQGQTTSRPVVRVYFDLIGMLNDNGLGQLAVTYHDRLSDLGTNLRLFFNTFENDHDNFDFIMKEDVADMLEDLRTGLQHFGDKLGHKSTKDFADRLKHVEDRLDKLRDYTRKSFDEITKHEHEGHHDSIYKQHKLGDALVKLSEGLGDSISADNLLQFQRVLAAFYGDVDESLDNALHQHVAYIEVDGQVPAKYSYLVDFHNELNADFDDIKATFYGPQTTSIVYTF